MDQTILILAYLIGSVTFIIGLKMLSHPQTARRGNLIAAAGMGIAILGTIFLYRQAEGEHLRNYGWIFCGLTVGAVIGVVAARRVKMTAMPEMVSMFNGMGGLCAALIAISEFYHLLHFNTTDVPGGFVLGFHIPKGEMVIIVLEMIIGSVSFSGSMVAFGKLNGKIRDYAFPAQQMVNLSLLGALVIFGIYFIWITPHLPAVAVENTSQYIPAISPYIFSAVFLLALAYGILFVLPIGGADMPVVISLLNACTGVAAACGGFLYNNAVMLTGGILVGSAGGILTVLMCKAMNRSLGNVLIGSFGGGGGGAKATSGTQGTFKEISVSDAAVVLAYAHKVMIVPGYGLAVAQAQHACHELEKLLEEKGVQVKYAIHPVAGRMPGHMNVLLAEADVPYDKLEEMEEANSEFATTDVVLILGANDVVNPAAKKDPSSPIYGMPILEVEQARTIIVNKRSMKPGYAGIENDLFFEPKTSMLFGDAKAVLQHLTTEIKNMG
jgi:NAD(P) transhydrogenase subunit beta